jgi:hypothetical protein
MNALFQWTQYGPYRPMNDEGTEPAGDCVELPEGQPVLMGSGITDDSGNWALAVRLALCVEMGIVDGVSIVATPTQHVPPNALQVLRPSIVTTAWTALGGNLTLRVRSWDLKGEAVPNVPFSWHATVSHHLE